jgi:hypothetical protein
MTALLDIWIGQKDFFEAKSVEQVIGIAGDGTLRDGNESSTQLRELLSNIPSQSIERYVNECLSHSFSQSGLVLQDLVNEIGHRLGFSIEPGYYRGGGSRIGFDGIWRAKDGYSFVIEVKTTDAYQINLDTQAQYRERLIEEGRIDERKSSILIVVGRKDTGGLEAQTRGSRHAWDARIISADALMKLMRIKESLTDSHTVTQVQEILKPLEYTRVDRLIDIIFTTSEDLQADEDEPEEETTSETSGTGRTQSKPVKYHEACLNRISTQLGVPLVKQGRCTYTNADQSTRVLCIVSKEYKRSGAIRYWYAFHPAQKEFLDEGSKSFIALGCGSADQIVLIPSDVFQKHLSEMRTTESNDRCYWHVEIFKKGGKFLLNKPTSEGIDVTKFIME